MERRLNAQQSSLPGMAQASPTYIGISRCPNSVCSDMSGRHPLPGRPGELDERPAWPVRRLAALVPGAVRAAGGAGQRELAGLSQQPLVDRASRSDLGPGGVTR